MRTFLLYISLLLGALIIAVSVPRQIRPELRLLPVWEFSFAGVDAAGRSGPGPENSPDTDTSDTDTSDTDTSDTDTTDAAGPFENDGEYALLNFRDGSVLSRGLKGQVFSASWYGFINQPEGSQRWVVQSWNDGAARYIDAQGTPHLAGSLLVQNDGATVYVTDIDSDESVSMELPPDLITYDVCSTCSGPVVVTAGLSGTIKHLSSAGTKLFNIHEEPFNAPRGTVIYSLSALPSGDVVVLHGLSPQTITIIPAQVFSHGDGPDGELQNPESIVSFEISSEDAVRYGVTVSRYGSGRFAVIPLSGGVGIVDLQEVQFRRVGTDFSADTVRGVSLDPYSLFSGNLRNGTHSVLTHDETGEAVFWSWADSRNLGIESDPFRLLLQTDDSTIAVGLEM